MARNTNVALTAGAWTQLTAGDVSAITFQNLGSGGIKVKGTADATTPTDDSGSIIYASLEGEANAALADLFPGISAKRVWAYSTGAGAAMVSHA